MEQIQKNNQPKESPIYEVVEGSNYEVIMTYGRQEVIKFEHFKKLANAIFRSDAQFVTVNKAIVQVNEIRRIEPTLKRTADQEVERRERQKVLIDTKRRLQYLENVKINHQNQFLNEKFPMGWKLLEVFKDRELMDLAREDFKKRMPEAWAELTVLLSKIEVLESTT